VDAYSLVAGSVLLLDSERVLSIVLPVCDCGAPKDFVNAVMQESLQDQKNPTPSFRLCSMSVFTSSEIHVLQGLQASRSCAQGGKNW